MALIPINQYKGKIKGRRTATAQEQRRFQAPLWQRSSEKEKEEANKKIRISVLWEVYNNRTKSWYIAEFNDQPALYEWKFNSLKDAMSYIPYYMRKKGAESNYKKVVEKANGEKIYIELDYRFVDNSDWYKEGKQIYSNDPKWFTNEIYTSQWIIKGKNFYRITFKQRISAVYTDNDDYHNPAPNPWSHNDNIKWVEENGKRHERSVRTYYGDDKPDTTYERQQAYRREKRNIQRMADEEIRHQLNMTPEEYRIYKHDMIHMTDQEWHEKYGVDHSYYND